ncbi:MAG TPA: DUF4244 domain-containing protein [Actinomycetaceae bacterium]|nr:DUF4244 domain-containing protein [Actinomycetaceae bacterium]
MSIRHFSRRVSAALAVRLSHLREREEGMVSAEYAVGILAAVAFALLLLAVVKSGAVKEALTGMVVGGLTV